MVTITILGPFVNATAFWDHHIVQNLLHTKTHALAMSSQSLASIPHQATLLQSLESPRDEGFSGQHTIAQRKRQGQDVADLLLDRLASHTGLRIAQKPSKTVRSRST